MKTIKILIISLILVTQSYAFSKGERKFLAGLGAGAIVAYALHASDIHADRVHHGQRVYVSSHDTMLRDRRTIKKAHRKHHRKHIRRHHKHHHYEEYASNHRRHHSH